MLGERVKGVKGPQACTEYSWIHPDKNKRLTNQGSGEDRDTGAESQINYAGALSSGAWRLTSSSPKQATRDFLPKNTTRKSGRTKVALQAET